MTSRTTRGLALACVLAATAWAQSPISPTVPPALRAHVRNERFQVVTAVRGLPLGVREELQRMFGSSAAAIADPGAPFQATDDITDPTVPARRLNLAGCSQDHCLVYYERGGIAHVWHAVLFHWTPDRTRVEAGGTAPRDLKTVDEVRTALSSGAITPTKSW